MRRFSDTIYAPNSRTSFAKRQDPALDNLPDEDINRLFECIQAITESSKAEDSKELRKDVSYNFIFCYGGSLVAPIPGVDTIGRFW